MIHTVSTAGVLRCCIKSIHEQAADLDGGVPNRLDCEYCGRRFEPTVLAKQEKTGKRRDSLTVWRPMFNQPEGYNA